MDLKDEMQGLGLFQKKKGSGRVEFLALKHEIKDALDSGYLAKEIWQHLSDKGVISIQYRMFLRYVHRFVKQKNVEMKPKPISQSTEPKRVHVEKPKHFEYDAKPMSVDELI